MKRAPFLQSLLRSSLPPPSHAHHHRLHPRPRARRVSQHLFVLCFRFQGEPGRSRGALGVGHVGARSGESWRGAAAVFLALFSHAKKKPRPNVRLALLAIVRDACAGDDLSDEEMARKLREDHVAGDLFVAFHEEAADIAETFAQRSPSRLIPDDEVAPILMAYFRRHLVPLLKEGDDAAAMEDQFVISLINEVRASKFTMGADLFFDQDEEMQAEIEEHESEFIFADRDHLIRLAALQLDGGEVEEDDPSVAECVRMLGGADKFDTHILPWAVEEEDRELLRSYCAANKRRRLELE